MILIFEHSAIDEQIGHQNAILLRRASIGFQLPKDAFFENLPARFNNSQRFIRKRVLNRYQPLGVFKVLHDGVYMRDGLLDKLNRLLQLFV